jgi:hypothetical protein
MSIITVDVAEVCRAIQTLLKDSQDVQDIGAAVELAEPVNEDPTRCPWVGIYPLRSPFPTRTLGMGGGFRAQNPEFVLVCQEQHANDGGACLDALGKLVKAVTSAVLTDPSLKGTVQMLGDFEVDFLGVLKVNDAIMQTATVRAVGLTTVSGG